MSQTQTFTLAGSDLSTRSAAAKGFFRWARKQNPDVLCLQETRAMPHQLSRAMLQPRGFHATYRPSERPGYSGVGIW